MGIYQRFVENTTLRRFLVLLIVGIVLFLARPMMTTILLTFIFTYLVARMCRKIRQWIKVPAVPLVIVVYLTILFLLYFAFTKYVPILIHQSVETYNSVLGFYEHSSAESNRIIKMIGQLLERNEIADQVKNGFVFLLTSLQDFGKFAFAFAMSMILSFFFLIEPAKMQHFSKMFLTSKFDWFFQDIYYFAKKFTDTFGVVLEAQFFIAICNTALTTVGLALIGFNRLPSLAIMVFLLSLIPVAGVIISLVPLSFIAYSTGGLHDLILVILLIIVVHLLEAYVLNPKFMSSRTNLPVFYTFVVLLVSERLFGVWGLIVGIPIFTFFLDILQVKPIQTKEKRPPEKIE